MSRPLTEKEVGAVQLLIAHGVDKRTVAQAMNISETSVTRIMRGKHYTQKACADKPDITLNETGKDIPADTREYYEYKVDEALRGILDKFNTLIAVCEEMRDMLK